MVRRKEKEGEKQKGFNEESLYFFLVLSQAQLITNGWMT